MAEAEVAGWRQGSGWGWIWGPDDEIGALNAMTPASRLAALATIGEGQVFDLGVPLDRGSFLWPGHVHTEVLPFRTARGIKTMGDLIPPDPSSMAFHTSVVMLSDHAGTQLDGLCHATSGDDDHWYNGFRSDEWCTDFGPSRASAEHIPPIIARGVLVDVAAHQGVEALAPSQPIEPDDVAAALDHQGVDVRPGDVVLVRTGALHYWGDDGHDHERIAGPDTAGITLATARWLCEDKGAMVIGSDTSTLEVVPAVDGTAVAPVHEYLLVEQGVHMGELHYLEDLSEAGVHEFCYIALTPKVRGTTAGFALRPVALV
jgi:kynurenine formamidase